MLKFMIICSWADFQFVCFREMEVFALNHAFPFSKMLTFYRKEPFDLEASYGKNVNLPLKDGFIGELKLMVEPTVNMLWQGSILKEYMKH